MTLDEYKKALRNHDWFYQFSDDGRVFNKGEQAGKALLATAKNGGDDFKRAYNEEHAQHFSTSSFVSKERPYKPPFPGLVSDPMDDPMF